VTVEHLLSHRSGIGDDLDEDADHEITDYLMNVSVHELATT
jgi:CubicO group peptidase (beta-lactamase class C family)